MQRQVKKSNNAEGFKKKPGRCPAFKLKKIIFKKYFSITIP